MASVGTTRRQNIAGIPDEMAELVLEISEQYDRESQDQRSEQVALWTKLENYFIGKQRIFWNMVAKDWRSIDNSESTKHWDKVINIYRAHAESIIAALSIKTPTAIFYPEDADIDEDVTTAKVSVKIKTLIERHNEAKLLLIKSLAILFNQGTVAAYIYNRKHSKYGTKKKAVYDSKNTLTKTTVLLNCSECGYNIDETVFEGNEASKVPEEEKTCPVCEHTGIPEQEEYTEELPILLGHNDEPKSRTLIEVFSPLFVHLPPYARSQENMPYLRLRFEQHIALLKEIYPKLEEKHGITPSAIVSQEERGLYVSSKNNLTTTDCLWVRPWAYNIVRDGKNQKELDKKIKALRERFPDGFYAVIIDDNLAEIHNEDLDSHWAVSENPLSTYIHGEPLGKPLAPIQDLLNEVVDLQIETFEHAIPETFARGDVLDFKAYAKSKAQPGMVFPTKVPPDGKSLAESFHSVKTATLSEEAELFTRKLEDKGQFVVGSFPSIYGGPSTSGSKTAKEYTESRAMAMQRLGITWNTIKPWWAKTMGKAVTLFIQALRQAGDDYRDVEKTQTGFVNNWIRQQDVEGQIGRVEADAEEDLPQTPGQLKDILTQLIGFKDETLNSAIFHPQNAPFLVKAMGAPDFFIPTSDIREKQYAEIQDLINDIPVEVRPWEKHEIEAEVCMTFLMGETGRILKVENREAWDRIEAHMIEHQTQEAQPPAPGAANPVEGASNAPA